MKSFRIGSFVLPVATLFVAGVMTISSCKKEELSATGSTFLDVEQKNSSFIVKHTGTWCAPCGGWGFTQFQSYIDTYGSTEVLAASVSGNIGGGNNEVVFDMFRDTLDLSATPTFHMNFGQDISAAAITAHQTAPVLVNSNYELSFTADKINIKTTTQFFQDVNGTEFYLIPYVIVDGIVADQAGHADGTNTVHKKSLVGVANVVGEFDPLYYGTKVAAGEIRNGYKVNLNFEFDRDASWAEDDISIGLVMSTKDAIGDPVFVNAYTKH